MPDSTPLELRLVTYEHHDGRSLVDEVQAYYVTIYGGPDTTPVRDDEFVPPQGAFFLGYAGGAAVAMGGWRFIDKLPGVAADHPAEIKRMYVINAMRGRGYARAVLAHLESTAREAGADALVLETGNNQLDAVTLYRTSGYVDIPHFGHYASEPGAVHLGKFLR